MWRSAAAKPVVAEVRFVGGASPRDATAGAAVTGDVMAAEAMPGAAMPAAASSLQQVARRSARSLHLRPCRSTPTTSAVDRRLYLHSGSRRSP